MKEEARMKNLLRAITVALALGAAVQVVTKTIAAKDVAGKSEETKSYVVAGAEPGI